MQVGGEARISKEEDVLHLKQLPSFDGALRPAESELLLQYLTVPYLRVPLLLRFFAEPSHVTALGSAKLQVVAVVGDVVVVRTAVCSAFTWHG